MSGVSRNTLVPRPETEDLVEIALGLDLAGRAGAGPRYRQRRDRAGLATERRDWQITAIDASAGAIDVARHNAHCSG